MSHLIKFRKGWQSEHLAKFIISKFAFIAEPANISDDLGSDFYCTIFDILDKGQLLPQSSFAIQIKSNSRKIEVTNKLSYLQNLEMPFFIGVVNKKLQKLTIYAGDAIPHFFSLYGNPSTLPIKTQTFIKLTETRDKEILISKDDKEPTYQMEFPKALEIDTTYDYERNKSTISTFLSMISIIQKNISANKSHEYLYDLIGFDNVMIYTGSGSVRTYQDNFCKRLAEAFLNLKWLALNNGEIRYAEFQIYESTLIQLQKIYPTIPNYLIYAYKNTKEALTHQ
jgi:hypothetical protein